jgi:prepilin peptidase CpaA
MTVPPACTGSPLSPISAATEEVATTVLAPHWIWAGLSVACLFATVTDLRSMRIPNWLTLPLFAAGMAYAVSTGGWDGLRSALGGAAMAGGIYILAYVMAGGGAGDAKLMLALGSWLDLRQAAVLVLAVALSGFLWAMIVVVRRGSLRDIPTWLMGGLGLTYFQFRGTLGGNAKRGGGHAGGPSDPPRKRPKHWYPYAPAILLGTVAAWTYTHQIGLLRVGFLR